MNHYVALGVLRTADAETIRSAFRMLVRRYHPDAGAGSSTPKFREIVEAYATLSDPVRRDRYDRTLAPARLRADTTPTPFRASSTPERLIPERSPAEPFRSARRSPGFRSVDVDLFDELFRALEDAFFRR
jgi:curved DNA-binding protein CbpA